MDIERMKAIDDFILQYSMKSKGMAEHEKLEMILTFMRDHGIVTSDFLKEINLVDNVLRQTLKHSSPAYWGAFMAGVAIGGLAFTNLVKYALIPSGVANMLMVFIAVSSVVLSLIGASKIKRLNVIDDILKTLQVS